MRNPQARATPEPKKPEDRERKPGSRASGDPATKWAAIGALAAVAVGIIALLAYAIPRPADISNVAADFSAMRWILEGALDQSYSTAVQRANSDLKTLDSACAIR